MAYDGGLAERVRDETDGQPLLSERRMFGGLAFLSDGNMCFAVIGSDLLVRVGQDAYAACLALPHVREMDLTGRPLRGLVLVAAEGLSEDGPLRDWLDRGLAFTDTLPPR